MKESRLSIYDKAKLRDEKDNARKKVIIAAAEHLFYEHGVNGTTTIMIASKAMMSKRAIYEFFKTKEDIYYAVVEKNKRLFVDLPRPEGEELPIYESLLKIFQLDLEETDEIHRIHFLQSINRESVESPEKIQYLYSSGEFNPREQLIDWLAKEVAKGKINVSDDDDLLVYAGMLMNIVFGALTPPRKSFDNLLSRKNHIKKALKIFLKGIGIIV